MIKAEEFRGMPQKDIYEESLRFANNIENEGKEIINIAMAYAAGEFFYTVYYK